MINLIIVVVIISALAAISRAVEHHGLVTLVWRWLTGYPMAGKPYTNATWIHSASKAITPTGNAVAWHHLPRLTRTAIRSGTTVIVPAVVYGVWKDRTLTLCVLGGLVTAAIFVCGWYVVKGMRALRTKRDLINPLSAPIAPMLGIGVRQARRAIQLQPGYATISRGEIGNITLPAHFAANPQERKAVEHLVSHRLPVEVDHQWDTRVNPQRLRLIAAPDPPSMVKFLDMIKEMQACKAGQVVIGLDRHSNVFHGSFTGDDPHWGFSVGSGRGKSTFLMLAAAQLLHNERGATVVGIDPKMASFPALVGVPGVVIANDPRDIGEWDTETQTLHGGMWGAIASVEIEMMRRLDILKDDPTAEFPIKVLMLDELNQFSAQTRAKWQAIKTKNDPSVPPVWQSIASIHWMGRAARCHCISVGQRLDDKATGGIGLRDSMGFRGLAGFRGAQWEMLIGTRPVPRSQKPKGRWIYSDGETETWVQNMLADVEPNRNAQIIRDYAMSGCNAAAVRDDVGQAGTVASGLASSEWVIGLDAAAACLGITVAALRKRREREGGNVAGETRKGNQPAWNKGELVKWASSERVSNA